MTILLKDDGALFKGVADKEDITSFTETVYNLCSHVKGKVIIWFDFTMAHADKLDIEELVRSRAIPKNIILRTRY